MKFSLILLIVSLFSGCALERVESQPIQADAKRDAAKIETKPTVLVELFTSEGCSSCPPADRALAFLDKNQPNPQVEIITLAFHVDYWNELGWKDKFSSPLFTQRQQFYASALKIPSPYTPQIVVDGRVQFTGSDLSKAQKVVAAAMIEEKAKIQLTQSSGKVAAKIDSLPKHTDSTVYLAIAEDNLSSAVNAGENSGNKLMHSSVVRELKMMGSISSQINSFVGETQVEFKPEWKHDDLKIVVFIQENVSRRIIGSALVRGSHQKSN